MQPTSPRAVVFARAALTIGAACLGACEATPESPERLGVLSQALSTLEFQQGAAPTAAYQGAADAVILSGAANTTHGSETSITVDQSSGGEGEARLLFRWDISAIPPGSVVQAATVTLESTNPSPGAVSVYEVKAAWVESEVTWNDRAASTAWQKPGCDGAMDRSTPPLTVTDAGTFTTDGVKALALGPLGACAVQRWVDAPASNFGILLTIDSDDGSDFPSKESGTASKRPKLSVVFSPPDAGVVSSCSPPDAGVVDAGGTTVDAGELPDAGPGEGRDAGPGSDGGGGPLTPSWEQNVKGFDCSQAPGLSAVALLSLLGPAVRLARRRSRR